MEYQEFVQLAQQAAQLAEKSSHEEAIQMWRRLLSSDISDLDKSVICVNLANVYKAIGYEQEALGWYDEGIRYESRYSRFWVAEQKAAYLAEEGMYWESIEVYEGLLSQPYLTEADKERIRGNVGILRGKAEEGLFR